jgi:Holliday junction DNA helicase RuvA
MIARLRGRAEHIGDDHLIVDVGPLGLTVFMPASQLLGLHAGQQVALFTHLHIREQDISLFGFGAAEDLQLFDLLLSVDGIGPRLALNILSTMTADSLRLAVANDEPGLLTRVPGIGVKTARKILFQLKDKLAPTDLEAAGLRLVGDADAEVIDALTTLGYSVVEAQRALQAIPKDTAGVEDRLRAALSYLAP